MKLPPTLATTATATTIEMTTMETNTPFSIDESNLYEFLSLLKDPESLLFQLLDKETNPQLTTTTTNTNDILRRTCQTLFAQIESYHQCWLQLKQTRRKKKTMNTTTTTPSSLADIDSLYIGHDTCIDAETIWGQIDLQNQALFRSLQRQLVKLESTTTAASTSTIQLVDWNQIQPEEQLQEEEQEQQQDDDDDDASDPSSTHEKDNDDDDDSAEVDSETQRIRNRMKRIREEMSDEDEDDDDDDDDNDDDDEEDDDNSNNNDMNQQHSTSSKNDTKDDEDDVVDPVRETLMDGFFDLHEMEAFADEEEEYHLPEQNEDNQNHNTKEQRTFKTKTTLKKSFHQRQRDGDLELEYSEEDDDDDDDDSDDKNTSSHLQQKQYRPQDEVDALFQIYEEPNDDDDEDDPAIHMTAADFFGVPNPNLLKKYQKSSNRFISKDKQSTDFATHDNDNDDDDDDSWDHHNFDDAKDWRTEEKGSDEDDDDDEEDVEITTANREDTKKQSQRNRGDRNLSQSDRLHKQTQDLELDMLAEKPWHMMGESKSTSRPVNSLLENTPEFQTAMKAAPILTVEHSLSLEEIIRKRILSEQYDNVLPRELPDVGWNAKRGELPEVSQEKSKLGLGELYEREYLQKALGYDRTASERESEESKIQMELKGLFASLCNKLDAMSHYHFCPRPIEPDTDIRPVATAPAIAMEETLPLFVSQARGVAPEEIYHSGIKSGVLRGDTEDPEHRHTLRNRKKVARRKAKKAKLADEKLVSRLVPYTSNSSTSNNNPYERRKLQEELQNARGKGQVRLGVEETTASSQTISKYTKSRSIFQQLESERTTSLQQPKESDTSLFQRSPSTKSSHSYKL